MSVDTSNVVVPDDFNCPISQDLMIDPVKTDCTGRNTSNPIKRLYDAIFSKSRFDGHVFENLQLALWHTTHSTCPTCRHRITKVVKDQEMARKIKQQFVDVNPANKAYFENIKRELEEDLSFICIPENPFLSSEQSVLENIKNYFTRFSNHPIQTFNEAINIEATINSYINNDDLDGAERLTKGFVSQRTQHLRYKEIAIAYINRNYLASNLIKAFRLINQITWSDFGSFELAISAKKELLKSLFQKAFSHDNLKMAESIADKIPDDNYSNFLIEPFQNDSSRDTLAFYKKIVNAYIDKPFTDSNFNEAKRIISTKMPNNVVQDECYSKMANAYAHNKMYSKGYDIAKNVRNPFDKWLIYFQVSLIGAVIITKSKIAKPLQAIKKILNKIRA